MNKSSLSQLTRDGKSAEGHSKTQCHRGRHFRLSVGHYNEEERLHSEASTVEQLPHHGGGEDAFLSKMIGQETATGNYYRHQEMRQTPDETRLRNI